MAIRVGHGVYQWHITFIGQRSRREVTVNVDAANIEQALGMAHPPEPKPPVPGGTLHQVDPEFWEVTRVTRGATTQQPFPTPGGPPRY